ADAETLNSQNEAELRRQFEERQQETEHVYELLENKIQLLQEESRLAKNEAPWMAALAEAEKECNLELSEKLKGVTKGGADAARDRVGPDPYAEALAQRDGWVTFAALFITCLVLDLEAVRAYSSPAVWSPLRTDSEWTVTISKSSWLPQPKNSFSKLSLRWFS
ncbi:myomegalin, partial [Pteropus vampyrus]|uniref:Myomegalin n=1 Tax=Pteropus vampyrus TaxID=132908 RepID=A0A6P3RT00_PTEVA